MASYIEIGESSSSPGTPSSGRARMYADASGNFIFLNDSGNSTSFTPGQVVGNLVASNNLSDILSASSARTNLGLGTSAVRDVGTGSGDVAAGNAVKFQETVVGGNTVITTVTSGRRLVLDSSVLIGDDTDSADAENEGAMRYRKTTDHWYLEIVAKTDASGVYTWMTVADGAIAGI